MSSRQPRRNRSNFRITFWISEELNSLKICKVLTALQALHNKIGLPIEKQHQIMLINIIENRFFQCNKTRFFQYTHYLIQKLWFSSRLDFRALNSRQGWNLPCCARGWSGSHDTILALTYLLEPPLEHTYIQLDDSLDTTKLKRE